VREVDSLGLLGENGDLAAGVVVALLELLQGGGGGALQAQLRAELGPVELKSSAALLRGDVLVF
jgi:hypothetical protein